MAVLPLRIAVLAAVLPLAGCALLGKKPAQAEPLWRFPLVEDGRVICEGELNPDGVATDTGLVVFTARNGRVYAVDGSKRVLAWTFVLGAPIDLPPAVLADRIVIADRDGGVQAIGFDGKPLWASRSGEARPAGLLAGPGRIVLAGSSGATGFGVADGKVLWTLKAAAALSAGPAGWRDLIVWGTEDGKIQIVSGDGRLLAAPSLGAVPAGTIFIAGDMAVIGFADGSMAGWHLPSMKRRWRIKLGGIPIVSPAFDGRRITTVLSNHVLFCLELRSGTTRWWQSLPGRGAYTPVLAETHVFASSPSETLYAYPRTGGGRTTAFQAPREIRTSPLWRPPHLWVGFFESEEDRTAVVFLKSPEPPAKEQIP